MPLSERGHVRFAAGAVGARRRRDPAPGVLQVRRQRQPQSVRGRAPKAARGDRRKVIAVSVLLMAIVWLAALLVLRVPLR